jgi:hypothetical protein
MLLCPGTNPFGGCHTAQKSEKKKIESQEFRNQIGLCGLWYVGLSRARRPLPPAVDGLGQRRHRQQKECARLFDVDQTTCQAPPRLFLRRSSCVLMRRSRSGDLLAHQVQQASSAIDLIASLPAAFLLYSISRAHRSSLALKQVSIS